jgi:23S rRNA (pseudouridine1915-N3)-methyltransferase
MKIELWSIGKENEKIFDAAIKEYGKRLDKYTNYKAVNIPSKAAITAPIQQQMLAEANQILALLTPTDMLVCLHDRGKQFTTEQFAEQINKWQIGSPKRIVFLIGGSYGLDQLLLDKSTSLLSLSAFTFPHQLVRLVFTEQLYRAFTVLANEKYHH